MYFSGRIVFDLGEPSVDEGLSTSLQESLLSVLAFNSNYGASIAAMVSPSHFEVPYRDIASRTLDYWHRWSKPPGDAHIDDIFDHVLGDPNHKQRQTYLRVLVGMQAQSKNLNAEYVANRVTDFITRQNLKAGVLKAAQRYQQGGDDVAEEVRRILLDTLKLDTQKLDPGVFLGDEKHALDFLDNIQGDGCKIGIKELDRLGAHPMRKELLTLMGRRGSGKSWFLSHMAVQAFFKAHWKVLHITLEMSRERCLQRYFQMLFHISKRKDEYRHAEMVLDDKGRLERLVRKTIRPQRTFQTSNSNGIYKEDPTIRSYLHHRIKEFKGPFNNLLIKDFPTGQLTYSKLVAYMDTLDRVQHFVPDLLLVDYPAIMWTDPDNLRQSLGRLIQDLRGLGVERNMAVVIAHQANRKGEKERDVQTYHAGEDISVIATSDTVVQYSQTEPEAAQGLARLTVGKARNDESHYSVLITQDYHQGQAVLDSVRMDKTYWTHLEDLIGKKAKSAAEEAEDGAEDDDADRDGIREHFGAAAD